MASSIYYVVHAVANVASALSAANGMSTSRLEKRDGMAWEGLTRGAKSIIEGMR